MTIQNSLLDKILTYFQGITHKCSEIRTHGGTSCSRFYSEFLKRAI